MRFENDGMVLWYGTPDAPAPSGIVLVATENQQALVTINAKVQPPSASNTAEVTYKVNDGPAATVTARLQNHDLVQKAQSFSARLPALHIGDKVDYYVVARCPGRQVPTSEEAAKFGSSFRVTGVGQRPMPTASLAETVLPKTVRPTAPGLASTGSVLPISQPPLPTTAPWGAGTALAATTAPQAVPPTIPAPASAPSAAPVSQPTSAATAPSSQGAAPAGTVPPPRPAGVKPVAQKAALASLLATSPLISSNHLTERFISLHEAHQGPIEDFWNKLRQEPEFKAPGVVEDLQFTLQLGLLSFNNQPLVQALQRLRQQGTLKLARDLVKLDANAWTQLINTTVSGQPINVPEGVPGASQAEKVANYVAAITDILRAAFPTAVVAQNIATASEIDLKAVKAVLARNPGLEPAGVLPANLNLTGMSTEDQAKAKASLDALRQEIKMFPGFDCNQVLAAASARNSPPSGAAAPPPPFENPIRDSISRFLANSPDFDFRTTHIDTYLATHAGPAFEGVPDAHRPTVTNQLKRMQRVLRVTLKYEATTALMGEGLDSAYKISSVPRKTFLQRFGDKLGGQNEALKIYNQAQHVNAFTLHLYRSVHAALNDVTPRVIGNISEQVQSVVKQIPDWETLFGSLSFCDCDQCRSVYSPAAYFVDLLQFLGKSGTNSLGKTPRDILFERRPDLQYIKLSCENTNTPLPYVDVVNEILETYVGEGQLDASAAKDTGDDTADELSANPQYINDAAYEKLKPAVYPFSLPFNRPLEVVRAYLEQLGSGRYQAMQTFQRGSNPSTLAIACEYLKISLEEHGILTGTDFASAPIASPRALPEFYGYAGNTPNLSQLLSNVPEVLGRTGLGYVDLVELVKTRFVNPTQAISLDVPPDADPCDLSKTTLTNLDDGELSRIHRFIRLWRKLGWQIQELDKAITALHAATDIDDALLMKLADVKRLQADLKLPLNQLLSFWANIDTTGRDSLYIKLFQNKAVLNPVNPAFQFTCVVPLAALPTFTLPDSTGNQISYDPVAKRLDFTGAMTDEERQQLLALSPEASYQSAINALYQANPALAGPCAGQISGGLHLARPLAVSLVPPSTTRGQGPPQAQASSGVPLAALPAFAFPDSPTNRISYDTVAKQLMFTGVMTSAEQAILFSLSDDPAYHLAVDNLYQLRSSESPKLAILTGNPGDARISTHTPTVLAALRITATDLAALTANEVTDDGLNLANLSKLYRFAVLAKALRLSVADLVSLKTMTGLDPFQAGVTASTIAFIEKVRKVQQSAFSVAQLSYIYRHVYDPNRGIAPQAANVNLLLTNLQTGLKKIVADTTVVLDPTGDLLRQKLAVVLDSSLIDSAMSLIAGTAVYSAPLAGLPNIVFPDPVRSKISYDTKAQQLLFTGNMTDAEKAQLASLSADTRYQTTINSLYQQPRIFLTNNLTSFLDPTEATTQLINNPLQAQGDRYSYALTGLMAYLRDSSSRSLIKQTLSDNLKLDTALVDLLLGTLLKSQVDPTRTAMADFMGLATSAAVDPGVRSYQLLHKVGLLVNTFKMTAGEVSYFAAHSVDFAGVNPANNAELAPFDLNAIPIDPSGFKVSLFRQWERLYDLFSLRDSTPQGEIGLIDVFRAASSSADPTKLSQTVLDTAVAATGWDASLVGGLAGAAGFGLTDAEFKNEIKLVSLRPCRDLVRRLGISAEQLFRWAGTPPGPGQAQDVKNTVKAKYDDQTWLTVAKSLNDGLRAKQRDALIAYSITLPSIKSQGIMDSDGLYEYFLIDVKMDSCMMTSRIVQATAAIQLFIQRCLMNLESLKDSNGAETGVSPAAIDADRWQWMKYYRVWEANRKVFLYPENWIEPDLRDNKSPFFKELESALLQNEITSDNVEAAFLKYLEDLEEVTRLEICGMYWQDVDPDTGEQVNTLHVFARSFHTPHAYHYRRLLSSGEWTAWEKVTADIQGDHLIPLIWNRRLFLFWPIFTPKADPPGLPSSVSPTSNTSIPVNSPKNYWEVSLAWSEYKQNKWSPKQLSSQPLVLKNDYHSKDQYVFRAALENGDLSIVCETPYVDWYDQEDSNNIYFEHRAEVARFRLTSLGQVQAGQEEDEYQSQEDPFLHPLGSHVHLDTFEEDSIQSGASGQLSLSLEPIDTLWYNQDANTPNAPLVVDSGTAKKFTLFLGATPSPFDILYPHQFFQFTLQAPFFYQDQTHTYFATPEVVDLLLVLANPNRVSPIIYAGRTLAGPTVANSIVPRSTRLLTGGTSLGTMRSSAFGAARASRIALARSVMNPAVLPTSSGQMVVPSFRGGVSPTSSGLATVRSVGTKQETKLAATGFPSISWAGRATAGADVLVQHSWIEPAFLQGTTDLKFSTFFHPYVTDFIKALNRKGIPGLLTLANQQPNDVGYYATDPDADWRYYGPSFGFFYSPQPQVEQPYPVQNVDFSYGGAYSLYNWELFFHAPLLLATRLSSNQRFEEAQKWFHYIFNPTTDSSDPVPQRYWNVLPFYQNTESGRIEDLLMLLDYQGSDPDTLARKSEVVRQVEEWRNSPFNPHLIARLRLIAYQKAVVMKYIDNLIAWGDYLFSQNTRESINEATHLYVLAADNLGPRTERVPNRGSVQEYTYHDLVRLGLDDFSNTLVTLENQFPFSSALTSSNGGNRGLSSPLGLGHKFYFCIAQNNQLLAYWDTVADRLFKIRHCMNIAGVVEQLPLFAPPIEPGLLVQAAAMGVDLASALSDINAATPYYRFNYVLQKALEVCAEVRALGSALLSALEKKDAEELTLLRATHETNILNMMEDVKKQQLDEANNQIEALKKSRTVPATRYVYYQTLLGTNSPAVPDIGQPVPVVAVPNQPSQIAEGGTRLLQEEQGELDCSHSAMKWQLESLSLESLAKILAEIPDIHIALHFWGIGVDAVFGGKALAAIAEFGADYLKGMSIIDCYSASHAGKMAGYFRRQQEWSLQSNLAANEIMQIDQQIAGANIRACIAQQELKVHQQQMQDAQDVQDFLTNKYTDQDLYAWMTSDISATYFQCYQMAYDLAKRAERAFRFERGITDSNYIQFGYWDSLKKGLQAGERLYLDLKRLEMAYLDQNKREYEIAKHISLVLNFPMALIALKQTGQCIIDLPEAFFDSDYPGHYMRRIKSATLTIPCVTGPYTSINCTLTLLKSSIRQNSNPQGSEGNYVRDVSSDDPRFVDNFSAIESIATSHAQNDSGMFELNFRDERYLPFEGRGAISTWRINLPKDTNAFDFETISDVILNLPYTSRGGGDPLGQAARAEVLSQPPQDALRLFSLKHEFPNDWYRFLHPVDVAPSQTMALDLSIERFPFQFRGRTIQIAKLELFLKFKDLNDPTTYKKDGTPLGDYAAGMPLTLHLTAPGATDTPGTLQSTNAVLNGLPHAAIDLTNQPGSLGSWQIETRDSEVGQIAASLQTTVTTNSTTHHRLKADVIEDVVMVCHYAVG